MARDRCCVDLHLRPLGACSTRKTWQTSTEAPFADTWVCNGVLPANWGLLCAVGVLFCLYTF